ncbi:peptidylprolyl isomerase [Salana multivorans]
MVAGGGGARRRWDHLGGLEQPRRARRLTERHVDLDRVADDGRHGAARPDGVAYDDTRALLRSPPATDSLGTTWDVTLHTNVGDIVLQLDGEHAPQAVASFLMLSKDGFYDGTACHRLLPSSLLQCGDPTASGMGGPGYSFGPIENAPEDDVYPAGTLAMARIGNDANSQGSQFFLVFNEVTLPSDSAGGYTVFGTVVQGLDILQSVGAAGTRTGASDGPPAEVVIIEEVTIA